LVENLKPQKVARYKPFIEKYGQISKFLSWHDLRYFSY